MAAHSLALFALAGSADYGRRVAERLATSLSPLEERGFEDGEHKIRPLVAVRGQDAYVVHALHGDARQSVNDKLCRLLFLIATLKDHGADRVTAVLPYLCYARKDRRTKTHDPITSRYVAALFEAVGTDRVIGFEVHNPAAFDNSFRCPTVHLDAAALFAEHVADACPKDALVVLSPDAGGVKRAEHFREELSRRADRAVDSAYVEKFRSAGVVTGGALIGAVSGKTVVILDDLVSTGGTLLRAAKACRLGGARRVIAIATHGLFVGGAPALFESEDLDRIVIADTVAPPQDLPASAARRLTVLDSAGIVADAIGEAHGEA